jgi:acyl-CoA thioesterase FadM
MRFFAIQYQILFHDTMAYGSHHHSTNIAFQNTARETLLFLSARNGQPPWQVQLKDIIILTRETYSLNLGPAMLGEKLAVLTSYENPTRSTVRLCFRTINAEGKPIACGYQTMILMDKETLELVPGPPLLAQYVDPSYENSLVEDLVDPSFAERIHCGSKELKNIFSEEVCELGRKIATAPLQESYPKFVSIAKNKPVERAHR